MRVLAYSRSCGPKCLLEIYLQGDIGPPGHEIAGSLAKDV